MVQKDRQTRPVRYFDTPLDDGYASAFDDLILL